MPAAHAFVIEGERWPGPAITVWNGTGYTGAVPAAIRAWNAAGAQIRFTSASSRVSADVVIRYGTSRDEGNANLGYGTPPSSVLLPRGLPRISAAALAAHELGHVLGLGHEPHRCSVMAAVVDTGRGSRCGIGACTVLWRCLVEPDDAAGAIALYGRGANG